MGLEMSVGQLPDFHQGEEGRLLLPSGCEVSITCFESAEMQRLITSFIEESLYALALAGMDLRALDGVTVAFDARKAAREIRYVPDGAVPLERNDQAETMEIGETVAVRRGEELRFHIVLRAGLGLMALSSKADEQALAWGCIAHEAAHVEHESHMYGMFPEIFDGTLDCGDRSKQTFIKALDVWSEYAACRSAAQFRPEWLEDFDKAFCLAFEGSRSKSQQSIENFRDGGKATETFREIQQSNGDAFICAGYLLGHINGLELHGAQHAPSTKELLLANPPLADLIAKLQRVLHDLWLSEFAWRSLEVFVPIYDLICQMMALNGMAFARHGDEWRIIMSDEPTKATALKNFLLFKAKESVPTSSGSRETLGSPS
jgi:hypothetical protein